MHMEFFGSRQVNFDNKIYQILLVGSYTTERHFLKLHAYVCVNVYMSLCMYVDVYIDSLVSIN